MTRCRNCLLHFLNCYWTSSVADYYVGPENASCYFEGCTFEGKANSAKGIWSPFNKTTNYCTFVNCTGNLPSNSLTPVAAPTYTYDHLTAATAKNYATNNTCGAGATLSVTTEALVSSSCDGGETPEDPVVGGDCCINLGLGEDPSTGNTGIPAGYCNLTIAYSLNHESSVWAQGFLNLGSNKDYITFDFSAYSAITLLNVSFDVTIPTWTESNNTVSYHWDNNTNTKYTINSSSTQNILLTAPANAHSFTIQRSAGKGTRISQVCFEVKVDSATAIENPTTKNAAQKVLRDGQILIHRDGKTYSILGFNQ